MKKVVPYLLIIILILTGCGQTKTNSPDDNSAQTKTDKNVYIMAGKVESNEEVNLTSKISGKVLNVAVQVGSKVNAGDPIIYLDATDIEAQVRQAEAGVNTAQATLEKIQSGTRPEQIEQANATYNSAKANYETAKSNFERVNTLYQNGSASRQAMETAQLQYSTAESQFKSTQEQLQMLNKGETKEALKVTESQVRQSQAALDVARTQLRNAVITSPIAGTISVCNISVGELASLSQTLVTVVNPGNLYVNAYVPNGIAGKLNVGDKTVIKISEITDKLYEGEILVIEPAVDSKSKDTIIKVSISNLDTSLKPGMFAEIALKK